MGTCDYLHRAYLHYRLSVRVNFNQRGRHFTRFKTLLFLIFIGIPSMILLFFVTCIPSVISRHNTDKWVSTDRCCNLMRSHPACCTRCCSGSKHCCARLSSMHIGASVLASMICVLFVVVLISGCSEVEYEK